MSTPMRAKMSITSVQIYSETMEKIFFTCVTSKPYGPKGESEDNTFALYSPQGEMNITITNPALIGKYRPGTKFYVDFTPAQD